MTQVNAFAEEQPIFRSRRSREPRVPVMYNISGNNYRLGWKKCCLEAGYVTRSEEWCSLIVDPHSDVGK